MDTEKIILLGLSAPFIWYFLKMILLFIVAIFFYKDSDTDKCQLEYLIEKERKEREGELWKKKK